MLRSTWLTQKRLDGVFFLGGGGISVERDMCFDLFSLFERENEKINLGS